MALCLDNPNTMQPQVVQHSCCCNHRLALFCLPWPHYGRLALSCQGAPQSAIEQAEQVLCILIDLTGSQSPNALQVALCNLQPGVQVALCLYGPVFLKRPVAPKFSIHGELWSNRV